MVQQVVQCTANAAPLSFRIMQANGQLIRLDIQVGRALIDREGIIRFFSYDYGTGEVQGYLLHPVRAAPVPGAVLWALDFLMGFGLSRVGSRLVKADPNKKAHEQELVHLGRYFLFSNPVGQAIRSFARNLFEDHHLGYHNVLTDQLVFTQVMRISR